MLCGVCVLVFAVVLSNFGIDASLRGSSCITPDGKHAVCRLWYECPKLRSIFPTKNEKERIYVEKSSCGNEIIDEFPEELLCCETTAANFRRNPRIPDRRTCGHDFSNRILSGESTAVNEFPWMVLMQYQLKNSDIRRWLCAGTLINERYVLTAAHCFTSTDYRLVNVRLGEFNISSPIDCQGSLCNNPEDIGVEKIIVHYEYHNGSVDNRNDIALLRLSRRVMYSKFIQPICLPRLNEAAEIGDRVTVAGWGQTEHHSMSNVKLKLEVPIVNHADCTKKYSHFLNLASTQICAGGVKGKDSCRGDSGGPLMKAANDDPSTWYLEGIVSFGNSCGLQGWPGVYTKVESFLSWIHDNVED
ncbi:unnamed protein product [Phyllotreta striolata]|uniref:CLIP domain-containing serine protease n=1 Tax=Phyllotreta striolata TaxID=444603 RepID=A0A9N9XLU4_PHYSR|nr:unnamed protein product [Phyllotreta striolata]